MIKERSKKEFEDDAVAIPGVDDDFIAARKKCVEGGCTLPPTQHLKMRVTQIHSVKLRITICVSTVKTQPTTS